MNSVPGVMTLESETSYVSLGSTSFPCALNLSLRSFSSLSYKFRARKIYALAVRRSTNNRVLYVASENKWFTASLASLAALKRLDLCWFILARGATPSARARSKIREERRILLTRRAEQRATEL
jgi:hypothetical protein